MGLLARIENGETTPEDARAVVVRLCAAIVAGAVFGAAIALCLVG